MDNIRRSQAVSDEMRMGEHIHRATTLPFYAHYSENALRYNKLIKVANDRGSELISCVLSSLPASEKNRPNI